eukprot:CAMPEP_0197856972 /NCGR_PEP_ID=MMETSP1438-20131217/29578_1 /TAXON_ID=1461541 /ORGANISM="Pterosperma sp., Strain CCMP1384" /LENGTH=49 /DNA_ID= /DNA_START= /DNA_END= /DNA_ORIENTATION=
MTARVQCDGVDQTQGHVVDAVDGRLFQVSRSVSSYHSGDDACRPHYAAD